MVRLESELEVSKEIKERGFAPLHSQFKSLGSSMEKRL